MLRQVANCRVGRIRVYSAHYNQVKTMAGPPRYFVHRWNSLDRTIDSICSICYATACQSPSLGQAKEGEDAHVCPPGAMERWRAQREGPAGEMEKSY